MALRQGAKALARSVMQSRLLPTRGGGGGPIKYAEAPSKPVPLYDEFWWDDGQLHSQPALDGVGEPMPYTPAQATMQLGVALSLVGAGIWAAKSSYDPESAICVPPQYPPEVLETYTSRGRVSWAVAPSAAAAAATKA